MATKLDQEAFAALYQRYSPLALGVCLKYLKDADGAKDATQAVFIKLWTDAAKLQVRKFKPWFYQVVKNHCLMELRKNDPNKNITAEWDLTAMEFEENLHPNCSDEQLLDYLEDCLSKLNTEQKSCVSLFYLEQNSYMQTATITGFSDKQVKSYIQNGRRNLRNCLRQKLG